MESDRARRLTTFLVGAGLLAGAVCLLVGTGLAVRKPLPDGACSLAAGEIPSALAAGDPAAWLSLGCLLVIATPCLRLVGMLLSFHSERAWRALTAATVVLALLVTGLAGALLSERRAALPGSSDAPSEPGSGRAGDR